MLAVSNLPSQPLCNRPDKQRLLKFLPRSGFVLFGVRSWDISTLVLVDGLLSLAALLASLMPARPTSELTFSETAPLRAGCSRPTLW